MAARSDVSSCHSLRQVVLQTHAEIAPRATLRFRLLATTLQECAREPSNRELRRESWNFYRSSDILVYLRRICSSRKPRLAESMDTAIFLVLACVGTRCRSPTLRKSAVAGMGCRRPADSPLRKKQPEGGRKDELNPLVVNSRAGRGGRDWWTASAAPLGGAWTPQMPGRTGRGGGEPDEGAPRVGESSVEAARRIAPCSPSAPD